MSQSEAVSPFEAALEAAINRRLPSIEAAVARAAEAAIERASANRLVSISEAAGIMGTSESALRKAMSRGQIPGVIRHGRSVHLRLGDLMRGTGGPDRSSKP